MSKGQLILTLLLQEKDSDVGLAQVYRPSIIREGMRLG